jgi:chromosomal replication initiation ATPase DnaA
LVVELLPADLESRVELLKNKTDLEGVEFQDDVAFSLATKYSTDSRVMLGALNSVIHSSKLQRMETKGLVSNVNI